MNHRELPILRSNSLRTSTALLVLASGATRLAAARLTEAAVISENLALEKRKELEI